MSPAIRMPPVTRRDSMSPAAEANQAGQFRTRAAGSRPVVIPAGSVRLKGTLAWPCHPSGFVLVIPTRHLAEPGPEESRLATRLRAEGLGTLLIQRPTEARGSDPEREPGEIPGVVEWLLRQPEVGGLPIGCLTIGAAGGEALAAAASSARIGAVVAYEGDPCRLVGVLAPTLVIVGDEDYKRLRLAQPAMVCSGGPALLADIPGVGTSQARAVEEAAHRASHWFVRHLVMEPAWQARHSHR